ncbi:CotS family spore coat protein [Candidatus Formimonas warabiya]|uniref:CotS family spore coat protein n=1 Tax=Formimonas warabiya TaxID=1761012 RepID=A0A3G1KX46_FORW1|nr:CotS family spore coat protein [Candidatus Formimonas warabiya]ATW27011.1 hypothetical protein DCMF_21595 [Candidatus Formimonas warabiya]
MDRDKMISILQWWEETPQEIKAVGDVYQVDTGRGKICLKEVTGSMDRVLMMMDAMNYVKSRGFSLMAPCIPARDGRMVVPDHQTYYFVQEWMEGREPDYRNAGDMSLAAEAVAQFHRASIGFTPGKGYQAKNKLGKWPQKLKEKTDDLKKFLHLARSVPQPKELEREFREHGDWLLDQAAESTDRLAQSRYQDLVEEARDWGTLVHGDTAARNFVLFQEKIYLIDFDAIAIDIHVTDLWRLLRRTLWRNHWDMSLTARVLKAYGKFVPLESKHMEVLLAFLQFPEIPWRIVKEYYEKKHEHFWNEPYLTEKFAYYVHQYREIERFLKAFAAMIYSWPEVNP